MADTITSQSETISILHAKLLHFFDICKFISRLKEKKGQLPQICDKMHDDAELKLLVGDAIWLWILSGTINKTKSPRLLAEKRTYYI